MNSPLPHGGRADSTTSTPLIEALLGRRSLAPRKQGTLAPDATELDVIFRCAMTAPDHGTLNPQRFRVLHRGEGMDKLADLFELAMREDHAAKGQPATDAKRDAKSDEEAVSPSSPPPLTADDIQKERNRALRGGLVIVASACIVPHPKVPADEQYATAVLATHHVLLACESMGYGGMILTGGRSAHPTVHRGLGFAPDERMVGFVHIGSVAAPPIPLTRATPIYTVWNG